MSQVTIKKRDKTPWCITEGDHRIVLFNDGVKPHKDILFDTVEEAVSYKYYVLGTEYEKLGVRENLRHLKEEIYWYNRIVNCEAREERCQKLIKEFPGYEEGYWLSEEWLALFPIYVEYEKVKQEIIFWQIDCMERIQDIIREESNLGEHGNNASFILWYDSKKIYENYSSPEIQKIQEEFRTHYGELRQMLEKIREEYLSVYQSFNRGYWLNLLRRTLLRLTYVKREAQEKYHYFRDKHLFFGGADLFERVYMQDLKGEDILYSEKEGTYNLIFVYSGGPYRLKYAGSTNKRNVLVDTRGQVQLNESIVYIDKHMEGESTLTEFTSFYNPNQL